MALQTVAMAYIFHKGKVLLVWHKKDRRYMSCGGKLEGEELVEEALLREIKEELNLDVSVISSSDLTHEKDGEVIIANPLCVITKTIPNGTRLQIFEYVCIVDNIDQLNIRNQELEKVTAFTLDEVLQSKEIQEIQKKIIQKAFEVIHNL